MDDDKIIVHFSRKRGERAGDRASERCDTLFIEKLRIFVHVSFSIVFQSSENVANTIGSCFCVVVRILPNIYSARLNVHRSRY